MNKIIGKMNAGIGYTIHGMKNASVNCKLDGKICGEEKRIRELTAEIGRLTVKSLDEKRSLGPEITERYEAICAAREKIRKTEQDRIVTKLTCPKCGAKTAAGMRYCGVCGEMLRQDGADE